MGDKDWRTVKLPAKLVEEIESIKNECGFSSNSDFITEGARELIRKYKQKRIEHFNFHDNIIRLIDNDLPKGRTIVEIFLKKQQLVCTKCERKDCVHIIACWEDPDIKKQLELKQVKINSDLEN